MRWFWQKYKEPDPEEFFLQLGRASRSNYTNEDRYRDFRQLFLSTEQGKRVLHELMSWGRVFKPTIPRPNEKEYMIWVNEGMRNFALKLMAALNAEPIDSPKKTSSKGDSQ